MANIQSITTCFDTDSMLTGVNQYELHNNQQNYDDSMDANYTGVIPRNFQQNIMNESNNSIPQRTQNPNDSIYSELTGEYISKDKFKHNNMQHFIKGQPKQNVDINRASTAFEHFTGSSSVYQKKKEVKCFQDKLPQNIYGAKTFTETIDPNQRYIPSQKQQNNLPFDQIKVGPGLAKGYTAKPSGGFNQDNSRDYIIPKSVDELRVKTNPKQTYQGRIIAGQKSTTRGLSVPPVKNKPDRFYKNSPDRYLKGSTVRAAKLREKFHFKPTNKQNQREHYGVVGNHDMNKTYKRGTYRKTRRHNYSNPTPRNAHAKEQWDSNQANSDYNRKSYFNRPNERDTTQNKPVVNNLTSLIKKLIVPVLDVMKPSRKENFIGNPRPSGNMAADMPSKPTVYDPNDVARTTIKETNIHNERTGNMGVYSKVQVRDPDDVAKPTIKETNIHNSEPERNMAPQQPNCIKVYDPEDIPKTTMKEVTIDNDHIGFVGVPEVNEGGYTTQRYKAKNTNKQFTSDNQYIGSPDGDVQSGPGRGYLTNRYSAKNTNKQFTSIHEYKGTPGSKDKSQMSYADKYNARLNYNKEKVLKGRKPTQNNVKLSSGKDTLSVQHKKIESDIMNTREPAETRVFQAPPRHNKCGLTVTRNKLPEQTNRERIDSDLLTAFRQNPYTQSLSSAL